MLSYTIDTIEAATFLNDNEKFCLMKFALLKEIDDTLESKKSVVGPALNSALIEVDTLLAKCEITEEGANLIREAWYNHYSSSPE